MRPPRPRDLWKYRRQLYTARNVSPVTVAYIEKTNGRKLYRPPEQIKLPPGFTRREPAVRAVKILARMASATGLDGRPAGLIDPDLVPAVWEAVRQSVADGRPPPPEAVAAFIQWPIPEDLREFVAEQHAGRVKRPRGPDPQSAFAWFEKGGSERGAWAYRVLRWKRAYGSAYWFRKRARAHRQKYGARTTPPAGFNPLEEALDRVQEEAGISRETLRDWLYPR